MTGSTMQTRTVARAVILGAIDALRPRLVLLDEPFTHLDSEAAEQLQTIRMGLSRMDGEDFPSTVFRIGLIGSCSLG